MAAMKYVLCWLGLFPSLAWAVPLNQSLDLGTSLSQSYEARNVFLHPASLGFETALHGAELTTSFAMGTNASTEQDLAFAAALGYFGLGIERLSAQNLSRYQFALGLPLYGDWFIGARLGLFRYFDSRSYDSWDFGLQYRPSRKFSLGLLFNQANQPLLGGSRVPLWTTLAFSLRPFRAIELSVDASTPSHQLFQNFSTQTVLSWSPLEGLKLRVGYHTDYQWLVGLQLHLGNLSLFSSVQPSQNDRRLVVGFQSAVTPYSTVFSPPKTAKVVLQQTLSEEKSAGGLLSAARPSLLDLLKDLESLELEPGTHEVFLRLDAFPLGLASALELHAALKRIRAAGKKVQVFLGNAGLREYLVASAADRIVLEPAGELRWLGLKAESYFAKGTLDKIGVEGEFLAAGKYKSAPELFLRKDSSEAARQATLEELASLEASLLTVLKKARRIEEKQWKRGLELGLMSAEEALKEKFVDAVGSYSQEVAHREKTEFVIAPERRRKDSLALPAQIAVVVANGNILSNRVRLLALSGSEQVTPASVQVKLKKAQSNPQTKAVILRVASPGGDVLASQQIATLLEETQSALPLFVSMGDVAASGGYFISAPAKRIFASPLTLTGSIGVFLGKFHFKGLYQFLDLHKEIQTTAPYPGLYSEDRPWSKAERAVMARRLENYYTSFLNYVSHNRRLSFEDVSAAAQGRVWTGQQALARQLVDELGGYYETVHYAAAQLGLERGEYEVREIETSKGFLEIFFRFCLGTR
jgi:protease-4